MRRHRIVRWILASACALVAAACGDDDAVAPSDSGVDAAVRDAMPTDVGGDAGPDDAGDTLPTNACINETDPMAVMATHGDDDTPFESVVRTCTLSCFGMGRQCMVDCLLMATDNPQITEGCAICTAAFTECVVRNCLAACPDPANPSPGCLACVCDGDNAEMISCNDDIFLPCSGFPSSALCARAPMDGGVGDGGSSSDGGTADGGATGDGGIDGGGDDGGAADGGAAPDASPDGST